MTGEFTPRNGIRIPDPMTIEQLDGVGTLTIGKTNAPTKIDGSTTTIGNSASATIIKGLTTTIERLSSDSIKANDGSSASPSYSFTSDTNTGIYLAAADSIGFSTASTNVGSISLTGWVLGPAVVAATNGVAHTINTGDQGSTYGWTHGVIKFANQSATVADPIITSATTDANSTGLTLSAATNNSNTAADMMFNVRESDNSDYATLTTTAFSWKRYGTELMSLKRDGALTVGNATTATNHQIQSNVSADYALKINNSNATNGHGLRVQSGTNTSATTVQGWFGAAALVGSIRGDGIWTIGQSLANNHSTAHILNGTLNGGGTGTTEGTQRLVFNVNTWDASEIQTARTAGIGGIKIRMMPRTTDTATCFSIVTNSAGDAVTGVTSVERVTMGQDGQLNLLSNKTSTSTTTGALTVAGGVGIAGRLSVGGQVISTGSVETSGSTFRINNASDKAFYFQTADALTIQGGVHYTASTEKVKLFAGTGTNGLVVDTAGGVGVTGELNVGGYTQLGGSAAPKTAMIKLTGNSTGYGLANKAHGLTKARIKSVIGCAASAAGAYPLGGYVNASVLFSTVSWDDTYLQLSCTGTAGGDSWGYTFYVVYEAS